MCFGGSSAATVDPEVEAAQKEQKRREQEERERLKRENLERNVTRTQSLSSTTRSLMPETDQSTSSALKKRMSGTYMRTASTKRAKSLIVGPSGGKGFYSKRG
tara:strand:+ start:174 stop:482 length:309 start_codon:yes stop_codon:yes gene_type:complete